ncbi:MULTISPECIES: hypothetical protein [Rheinheimera]|uniref:Uncharacterized protein n=1 Tax=Rheinheimera marina TaxID=1774958 RepID=A0ABV9JLT3_9GAMM
MKLSSQQIQLLQHNGIQPLTLHAHFSQLQSSFAEPSESFAEAADQIAPEPQAELQVREPETGHPLTQDIQHALHSYAPSLTWRLADTAIQLASEQLLTPETLDAGQKRLMWQLITQYHEEHSDSKDPQRN